MIKKVFLTPFFMPVAFGVCYLSFMAVVYFGGHGDILSYTKEGGIIEFICHFGYILLIGMLLIVCNDYKDKIRSWGMFLFLALIAFLREAGVHHHLSKTDTTPFKSRFFLNPNNPWEEKVIFGALLLVVLAAVLYLAYKYSKHLIKTFFEMNIITWSIATLCTIGVVGKIVDRFPANYRKANNGVALDADVFEVFQLCEEASEMFLPYIAVLILLQYRMIGKK
jgi:hypothetical protein